MSSSVSLFWFRQDLRLSDNPGLIKAASIGSVIPIYILDTLSPDPFKMGGATEVYLHHSLESLNESLDSKLNFYKEEPKAILSKLIKAYKIENLFWNRCYEPWYLEEDRKLEEALEPLGVNIEIFNASYLWDPKEVTKDDGSYYKVYTPYQKKVFQKTVAKPLPKPKILELIKDHSHSTTLEALALLPNHNWGEKIMRYWESGEKAAQKKLKSFVQHQLQGYQMGRDFPSFHQNSGLSPNLHFGEISPAQVWAAIEGASGSQPSEEDTLCFLKEIVWREFSCYLLTHFKGLGSDNFQSKFDGFAWKNNPAALKAWQKGLTGFPLVDAGMRELWETGTMHNRVRMVVASFLVKNLMIHWHHGRDWFWETLVDADLANNSFNWQWVAGSGADAAPYFRIFNPSTQAQKFDAQGLYIKKYVPELKELPLKYLFTPWEAPTEVLTQAGIVLGKTYPKPIVCLKESRTKALEAYKNIK